jgi:Helix-turn-helix domain
VSGRALGWAFENLPFLRDASEKLVLAKLAQRADDEAAKCWPAVDTTAADLGISRRSVLRSFKNLEELGLIVVQRRPNCSSIFTLQLNFSLVVDATVARQAEPADAIVSPSQCHRVTEPVPPCHPNQTLNQTLNKKQQHLVVVFEKLVWEKPLTTSEKTACEYLLAVAALPLEICQKFADEMAGDGRRQPIRNPAGWLRNMIERYRRPGFSFAYAGQVAAARAGRVAQAQRESLALPPPPPRTLDARPPLSDAGRAALASLGKLPKSAPIGGKASPISVETAPILSSSSHDCVKTAQL